MFTSKEFLSIMYKLKKYENVDNTIRYANSNKACRLKEVSLMLNIMLISEVIMFNCMIALPPEYPLAS